MKEYILAVCGSVILSALVMILLPEGKTGKFINGVLKLFCLLVMLVPLLGLFASGETGTDIFTSEDAEIELDDSFIETMFARRAQEEAELLQADLEERYGIGTEAEIGWENVAYAFTVKNVQVKILDFGIYGKDEHIFVIAQVEERVSAFYQGAEVIVYG